MLAMADVRPIQGIRYSADHIDALAAVVTPPYDVITPEDQASFYDRHPLNIIRLELGRDLPEDDALENRYTRAASTFAEWRRDGVLTQDAQPSFYVYRQHFRYDDRDLVRTSLLARVRLEPWEAGVIVPHEQTMSKPKSDRLQLLRATAANLSPLMATFDDPGGAIGATFATVTKDAPLAEFRDGADETHQLWLVRDANIAATLHAAFADRQLFIADGHHRYETSLTYRDEVRELQRGLAPDDAANFVLMALIPTEDPGLVILPTHRLVRGVDSQRIADLPTSLAQSWQVETLAKNETTALEEQLRLAGQTGKIAALVATRKHRWLVRLSAAGKDRLTATGEPAPWQQLDVAAVQELILGTALGIDRAAVTSGEQVSYTRDLTQALAMLEDGTAQVAILLNPTWPAQVRDVALAGGRMPQKSTYFYPKLITGLVINPLW